MKKFFFKVFFSNLANFGIQIVRTKTVWQLKSIFMVQYIAESQIRIMTLKRVNSIIKKLRGYTPLW